MQRLSINVVGSDGVPVGCVPSVAMAVPKTASGRAGKKNVLLGCKKNQALPSEGCKKNQASEHV